MAFDPKRHVIRIQGGREYLPVSARLVWFRGEHPDWGIVTNPIEINLEKQYAIFSAQIFNAEGKLMATATKMENVRGFQDYVEKSETGAVGRALAMCGYGTQFAPELEEGPRFQGSPMGAGNRFAPRPNGPMNGNGGMRSAPQRPAPPQEDEDEIFDEAPVAPPAPAPRNPAPAAARPSSAAANSGVTRVREPERESFDPAGPDDVDEDPFADEAEAPVAPAPLAKPAPARAEAKADGGDGVGAGLNRCSVDGCTNVLTASQMTMAMNKFGKAVCLIHQRDMAPAAAATGGSRRANPKAGGETLL